MKNKIEKIMASYSYNPAVTEYLDSRREKFAKGNFSFEDLFAIMLWKIDRIPTKDGKLLDEKILEDFKKLAAVSGIEGNEDFVEEALNSLLQINQFEIPMVSTILSFLNPDVFQIIDIRTNRIIMGNQKSKGYKKTYGKNPARYYIDYLKELRHYQVPFEIAVRFFYQLDKMNFESLNAPFTAERIVEIQKEWKK